MALTYERLAALVGTENADVLIERAAGERVPSRDEAEKVTAERHMRVRQIIADAARVPKP